jgi:thymidylate synthase (FAD)
MDARAQAEIRAYACTIGEQIIALWVPNVWEAFVDYRQHSVHLSRIESQVLEALIAGDSKRAIDTADKAGLLKVSKSGQLVASRERKELEAKLHRFGVKAPW